MYNKNVKKTFEILRSEITFLMDLYINGAKTRSCMYHVTISINLHPSDRRQ